MQCLIGTVVYLRRNKAKSTEPKQINSDALSISDVFEIKKRGIEQKLVIGQYHPEADHKLMNLLARTHTWAEKIKTSTTITSIAKIEGKSLSFIKNSIALAFLSPKIQSDIMNGTGPAHWSTKYFVIQNVPIDWQEQELQFYEASNTLRKNHF